MATNNITDMYSMNQNTGIQSAQGCNRPGSNGGVPRLAMLNDVAGFGHCSTAVSLPIISVLGVQVCPVPTSILSNHFAFPHYYHEDYTPHMRDYLHAWEQLQLKFDGLYCGFLGNEAQIEIVEEFLSVFRPGFFLLDPVMGDHGRYYSSVTPAHCRGLRSLMQHADIITPNLTEACLLTDTPYQEGKWTEYELQSICDKLSKYCKGSIVITGLHSTSSFLNYIWQDGVRSTCTTHKSGTSRPGTGDIFASILAADALLQVPLAVSVQKAADFIALCIAGSDKAGIPINHGVIFEKYLGSLLTKTPS